MKPLLKRQSFLKRFNSFKNGEFRSLEIISPSVILITLAGQDEAREYDWKTVKLEFSNITDAQLVEDKKLPMIPMDNGISIIEKDGFLAFAIGECYNISHIKTSIFYVQAQTIKYKEDNF